MNSHSTKKLVRNRNSKPTECNITQPAPKLQMGTMRKPHRTSEELPETLRGTSSNRLINAKQHNTRGTRGIIKLATTILVPREQVHRDVQLGRPDDRSTPLHHVPERVGTGARVAECTMERAARPYASRRGARRRRALWE